MGGRESVRAAYDEGETVYYFWMDGWTQMQE